MHPSEPKTTISEDKNSNKIEEKQNKILLTSPPAKLSNPQNFGEEEEIRKTTKNFVNLDTLGLRRSERIAQNPKQ